LDGLLEGNPVCDVVGALVSISTDEKVAVTNKLVQPEIDYIIGGFRNPITHALRGWTVGCVDGRKLGRTSAFGTELHGNKLGGLE